jgi:hypothetical protein
LRPWAFPALAAVVGFFLGAGPASGQEKIDNSALIPKLLPDDQVQMEDNAPDWVKSLIMAEVHLETATPDGTFAAATQVLDHYAEMGVNGLWIDPIYDRSPGINGYGNLGPQTIYAKLSGTSDVDGSFQAAKTFVDEAHRRNIRIFFDIIVWGTTANSPLVTDHPEFYEKKNGDFVKVWGGYAWDWKSPELKSWFKDAAVNLIDKTGADGFRVDLAPDASGYFFKEVRDALYAEGKKIVVISEIGSARRDVFDFEQVGVNGWPERPDYAHPEHQKEQKKQYGTHSEYLLNHNIVDVIHSGAGIGDWQLQQQDQGANFRFYTSNLLDHDDPGPFAKGDRVRFAYSTLFAPFLPIWYIGEEWNNPRQMLPQVPGGVMYFNTIDWSQLDRNADFYEDTKKYIQIRRSHPDIFENFPTHTRDANIAKLDTTIDGAPNPLQAYARFAGGRAILIVPNNSNAGAQFKVNPDYDKLGLDATAPYKITDLMTGQTVSTDPQSIDDKSFTVSIDAGHLGIYLLDR